MRKSLLLCFMIFVSLGIFLMGSHSVLAAEQSPKEGNQPIPVAKETDQKPRASEDVNKIVEEARRMIRISLINPTRNRNVLEV